jgi:hypothetical protein
MRQETMKAELKLFIRMVITEQLEKWADESSNVKKSPIKKKKSKKVPKKKKVV